MPILLSYDVSKINPFPKFYNDWCLNVMEHWYCLSYLGVWPLLQMLRSSNFELKLLRILEGFKGVVLEGNSRTNLYEELHGCY